MEQQTTIDKALDVLFHLHGQPEPQGVSDIGRALAIPKSSTHRLLSSLTRRGLVERDAGGKYRPGIALLGLALGLLDREPLVVAARAVLEEAARQLDETFFLVGDRAGGLTVLDKAEGTGLLRASPTVGSAVPVHATAAGKLYLALAPERVQLAASPERFTARTVTTQGQVDAAVAEARSCGHAINRGEWIEGLTVIAAPVVTGPRLHGVLAVALASSRLDVLNEDAIITQLGQAAGRIAGRLEGRLQQEAPR